MLTPEDHKRVVHLRFGSLTDFTRVQLSYTVISRRLLIPRPTVVNTLQRFSVRGHDLEALKRRKTRFVCIPRDV